MERERGVPKLTVGILCFSAGFNIAAIISTTMDDSDEQFRNAQVYNAQLADQLEDSYPSIQDLVLVEDKDFTFSINQGGEAQSCTGEFEVKENIAAAVGEIVCSISTPIATTVTTLG